MTESAASQRELIAFRIGRQEFCVDIMSVRETAGHLIDGFGRHRAYVQVQNGCDHRCTFCIIPSMRGDLVSRPVWMRRYGQINAFEESTVAKNTTIIKVMLHISADEQKARLAERLEDPEKFYKFNPGDLVERSYWSEYQEAYQAVLDRTATDYAPWHVVPCNRKWYSRLAVLELLIEALKSLDLSWPPAEFDVEAEKKRLAQA